jgi:CRISPR system Cascade subunit CasC
MKIELHLLQNFAPSNLNRDDTGAPKDCEFGGYRRARISSQCQKRAIRNAFRLDGLLPDDNLAARTKRLVHEVAAELRRKHGHDEARSVAVAAGAVEGVGLGRNKKGAGDDAWKTEYLLFVPRRVVAALADLLHEHWAKLEPIAPALGPPEPEATAAPAEGAKAKGAKKETKKDAKREAKANYPKEVTQHVEGLLEGARGVADLALFGRMIADKPDWNVNAACQVAHAISANKVQVDFDFFTAIDDFKPGETAGSDMMGTVAFNSSCFYRYAVLDVAALRANLGDGPGNALLRATVDAFVRAFVTAVPTGKQNGMAAHNFPSYVLAVVRERGSSIALTNAFLKPARPAGDVDLVDDAIGKLEAYLGRMREVLGEAATFTWADRNLEPAEGLVRAEKLANLYHEVGERAARAGAPKP